MHAEKLFHVVNYYDVYLFPLKFADKTFDCLSFGLWMRSIGFRLSEFLRKILQTRHFE